jgi:hypothetical protein
LLLGLELRSDEGDGLGTLLGLLEGGTVTGESSTVLKQPQSSTLQYSQRTSGLVV